MSVDNTLADASEAKTRRVSIRLFAGARQRAGRETVQIDLPPGATISEARRSLGREVPALADQLPYLLFAIGTEYAGDDNLIPEHCELSAFPPVSGG